MSAMVAAPARSPGEVPARRFGLARGLAALCATSTGAAGLAIIAILLLLAVFAPVLPLHDPLVLSMDHRLQPPGARFLFGTDQSGRDILARVVWGTRTSLVIGILMVAIGLMLGVAVGLLAGFYSGGWIEEALMRLMEVLAAIPLLIWAIAMVGVLGVDPIAIGPLRITNEAKIVMLVGLLYAPGLARLTHALVLGEAQAEYVLARRLQGASALRIMLGDILPNCLPPILVQASILLGVGIIIEASLSFIGLGVQPPTPSWGAMLSDARSLIFSGEWWVSAFPGAAIFLAVMGFNLVGDALRTALDPRRRSLSRGGSLLA
jgi:peptide/nickel transport system permease protein